MNCRRCGAALAPDALGCPVCGEPARGAGTAGDAFAELGGGAGTADNVFVEPAGNVGTTGGAFPEPVAAADLRPLSPNDLPQISAEPPEGADATADSDGLDGEEKAFCEDGDEGESGGESEDAPNDPFIPSPAPAFSDSAAFPSRNAADLYEPLPHMAAPALATGAEGIAEARPRMRGGGKVLIALVVLVLLAALAGVACVWVHNSRLVAESNVRYTVSYETNGGSLVESQEVKTGTLITAPREPTISGRYFAGWYTDTTYQTQVTFPLEVDHDMTLYARWLRDKDKADAALSKQDKSQDAAQGEAAARDSAQGTAENG